MHKIAAERGLDPDQWLNNVELVTAEKIGIETTTLCQEHLQILYCLQLTVPMQEARKQAREALSNG
jgi:hypothetical protein